MNQSVQLVIAH